MSSLTFNLIITAFFAISAFCFPNQGVQCQANVLKDAIWRQGEGTRKEYLFTNPQNEGFNFVQSRGFCVENDATLPMIKSPEEQDAVFNLLRTGDAIWLGGRKEWDKEFLWFDGTVIDRKETYTNWVDSFHPNLAYDGISMQAKDGKWRNANFILVWKAVVCERPLQRGGEQSGLLNQKLDSIGKQIAKQTATFDSKLRVLGNTMDVKLNKIAKDLNEEREIKQKLQVENSYKLDKILRKLEI